MILTRESVVLATKSAKSLSDAAITMIMLYHTETVSSYFVTYLLCVCVGGGGVAIDASLENGGWWGTLPNQLNNWTTFSAYMVLVHVLLFSFHFSVL